MKCFTLLFSLGKSLVNVVWIDFEFADIFGDFVTWYEYKEGLLMPVPDVHVQRALLVFAIFGLVVSLFGILLYLFKFGLIWSPDLSDDHSERYDCLDLAVSCALLIEVVPQSMIGFYALQRCPPKKYDVAWVDGLFSITCLLQYFPIWLTFSCHCCCYHETMTGRKALIISVFFLLSVIGMIFASLTIRTFRE